MVRKFILGFCILIIISTLSIPMKLINSGHTNKYKVQVSLTNGTKFIAYTTKTDYDNYIRHNDLKLTRRTVKYSTIKYVIQIYNPFGSKTVNMPIHN